METAKWMLGRIRAIDPTFKEPTLRRWANEIRLMRERDQRTDQQIRSLFALANEDSFWRSNILCPSKLREKWTQLSLRLGVNGQQRNDAPVEYAN
jgi:hypothetical protein